MIRRPGAHKPTYNLPGADCTGTHRAYKGLPSTTVKNVRAIRPPDLIIQDELHLISGPLGSLVGIYEGAIDHLTTWEVNGKKVRPKVIASTATVRRAQAQVSALFNRSVRVFPPPGLEAGANFFSKELANKVNRVEVQAAGTVDFIVVSFWFALPR